MFILKDVNYVYLLTCVCVCADTLQLLFVCLQTSYGDDVISKKTTNIYCGMFIV